MVGTTWRQAAGHTASAVRKQKETTTGAQLTLSFLFSPEPQARMTVNLPTKTQSLSDMPGGLSLGTSKSCQVGNQY